MHMDNILLLVLSMACIHCSNSLALHLVQRKPFNQLECGVDLSVVKNGPPGRVRKGRAWFVGKKPTFVSLYLIQNLL